MSGCDFCREGGIERAARWSGTEVAKGSRGLTVIYWATACDEHKGRLVQDAPIEELGRGK